MKNVGYLTSKHTPKSDKCYTPQYVVDAIGMYLPKNSWEGWGTTTVLCPFDKDEHAFPIVFRDRGYNVINTHFDPETGEGKDFFSYTKKDMDDMKIDYIISNPPFSLKDAVLEHLETLDTPYAMLVPLPTLQGIDRFKKVFSKGNTQVLIFDKRIPYSTDDKHWSEMNGNHFASIFVCKNVLPQRLVFDELIVRHDF